MDAYVRDLDLALRGPRWARTDLMREARDHLQDAAEAGADAGLGPEEAVRVAVRDFGPVAEVAPAYQAVLSSSLARRASGWLVVVVAAQPLLWEWWGRWHPEPPPPGTREAFVMLDAMIALTGGVAAAVAVLGTFACGVGARWWGCPERITRAVAWSVLVGVGIVLAQALLMYALGGDHGWAPTAYLLAVAVVPMTSVLAAAHGCLRSLR